MPAKDRAEYPRNGKRSLGLEMWDSRDFPAPLTQSIGSSNPFKSAGLASKITRFKLDPTAPRLTQQFEFKWEPFPNTLCITKLIGEKGQVKWVGLKHKAIGLAQPKACASSQAQDLIIGSATTKVDQTHFSANPEPSTHFPCSIDPNNVRDFCSSSSDVNDGELEPTLVLNGARIECVQDDSSPSPLV